MGRARRREVAATTLKEVPRFYGLQIGGPLETAVKIRPRNFTGRPEIQICGACFRAML
jgi:hypothetical protein